MCSKFIIHNYSVKPAYIINYAWGGLTPSAHTQHQSESMASSVFNFNTNRPVQLPITDINLPLSRQTGVGVGVELGPVCFMR